MRVSWLVVGAAAMVFSCAEAPVSSTGPQSIPLTPAAAARGGSVSAGVTFGVTLDQALDTRLTRPGTAFSVTLSEPLRDVDGQVVIPAGTKIEGSVYSTGAIEAPHLTLSFHDLMHDNRAIPIAVKVVSAETDRYQAWVEPPGHAGAEEMLQAMPQMYEQRAVNAYSPPGTMPIFMKEGAKMRLELMQPIFAPH